MTEQVAASRPFRALHLLHTIDYGGVETIIINWLRALNPAKVEVFLVCFANPGGTERLFVEAAQAAGFQVRTIDWNRRKPIWRASNALIRLIEETGAQVVHTHNTYADIVGLVAARRLGIRTVSSLYVWSNFGWKRRALEWISQCALRYFDCVTAQCEATKRDTCSRGIDERKVRVLHSGFDAPGRAITEQTRQALRAEHGLGPDDVLMVNIARLYPEKAQDILLREFKQIHARHPNTRLWILGRGPLEDELNALCKELDLDGAVRLTGYVANPDELARLADIQVHPSYVEGIPLALLLGMSLGLPIVASAVGGIDEVIEQNERGILVPSAEGEGFSEAFKDALVRLIEDPGERARLGENARSFIENDYSLQAAARTLENIYREVING